MRWKLFERKNVALLMMAGMLAGALTLPIQGTVVPASAEPAAFADEFEEVGAPGPLWSISRGSWTQAEGYMMVSGSMGDRVLGFTGVELGSSYSVEALLAVPAGEPASSRAGLAINVEEHEDGSQSFYALRVNPGTSLTSTTGGWQLVRIEKSAPAESDALVAGGQLSLVRGETLRVGISAVDDGSILHLRAWNQAGAVVLERYVVLPTDTIRWGGYAGLYSNSGATLFDQFELMTSGHPAQKPLDPGPLVCAPTTGDGGVLPDATESIAEVSEVGLTWAGHPVAQSLITTESEQYVGYYDEDRVMTIARRDLGTDAWVKQSLPSVLGWDSHNYIAMEIDRDGNLHVAGNMHNVPLVYFRTTTPGEIGSLERVTTMVASENESRMTYPRFRKGADGQLVYSFRDGQSGSGTTYYYAYDESSQTWSDLVSGSFFDGQDMRSAYEAGPTLGPDGYYHMAWVWRDNPDAGTNSLLTYMRSRDLVNWETSGGQPLPLPITYGEGDIVDPVPIFGGLLNGSIRIGFDDANRTVITYHKYDTDKNLQIYAARADGSGAWEHVQISDWTGRWLITGLGSLEQEVSVGGVTSIGDGKLRLDYGCHGTNRTWILDAVSLEQRFDVPRPSLPDEISLVEADFPGIQVQTGISPDPGGDGRYLLRWESMPTNQDQPRPPELTPPAQPLRIYHLIPAESGNAEVCESFNRSDLTWNWGERITVRRNGITVDKPAGSHNGIVVAAESMSDVSVRVFSNGRWEDAIVNQPLTGMYGSDVQEILVCGSTQ